ncbi:MAG: PQQ-binding-like beta-propeller repeat protein [Gammaproteobacteria bacterium]|nr:PQQ-binding-like beta-propeller repeat protein [Gammaproteobacteria bacterium]MDE0365243.1 PQQ-binding-like beta-propeller repeat protein [Gammaproteobacteria bacterium]
MTPAACNGDSPGDHRARNLAARILSVILLVSAPVADGAERPPCAIQGSCAEGTALPPSAGAATPRQTIETALGERVFSERCAECHSSSVIEPSVAGLTKLNPEYIYRSLWSGIMREAAVGLNDAERQAVAQYLGGLVPEKPSAEVSNFCDAKALTANGATGAWGAWAPDTRNSRHLADSGLTAQQVARARLKWAFVIPDTGSTTNAGNQPTVHAGRLYIGSRSGFVFALDARSGCIHWQYRPVAGVRSAIAIDDGKAIFADYENYVYALATGTGELLWRNKADEQPSARVNGSVTVHDGRVYVPVSTNQGFVNALDPRLPCCTFQGTVTAFDTRSGRRLWQARIIDEPLRELGPSPSGTMRYGPSGGSVWSVPTVDAGRGLLYVGTSNQKTGPPIPESDAVVALDLRTGAKQWVRSFAPPRFGGLDIWNGGCVGVFADPEEECPPENQSLEGDRDIGAPIVLQTRSDGAEILLAASKDGMLYALDPDRDGETIWQSRVGRIIRIRGPSFGGVEHGIAADDDRAYVPIADIDVMENTAAGSLVAVDLGSGEIAWRADAADDWCSGKPDRCYTSITSPPTIAGEVVFAGANDGVLRAYDKKTGETVWAFDTAFAVDGVNGLSGSGGSISRGGTALVEGMFFQSSGYGQGLGMPGNVLFAFEYPQD